MRKRSFWYYVWITIRELVLLVGGIFVWGFGSLIIAFGLYHQGVMLIAWYLFLLSLYSAHLLKCAK